MTTRGYTFTATEAVREQIKLRAGFCGTTGSGKTYTSLLLASRMADKMGAGPVYVIDTEHKSALRYAYSPRTGQGFRFKHVPMPPDDCSPDAYLAALEFCESQGAGIIVIDSLSHLWAGANGVLEQVDQATAESRNPRDTFGQGWKKMTPIHTRTIERVMQSQAHVLFTLRAKSDYVITEDDRGKKAPKKVGMAPVAREGIDYEPDGFFSMEAQGRDTVLWVDKTRVLDRPALARGAKYTNPGDDFAHEVIAWLEDGEPVVDPLDTEVERAAAASTSREAYDAARVGLVDWMREHRVPQARGEAALSTLKQRVAGARAEAQP